MTDGRRLKHNRISFCRIGSCGSTPEYCGGSSPNGNGPSGNTNDGLINENQFNCVFDQLDGPTRARRWQGKSSRSPCSLFVTLDMISRLARGVGTSVIQTTESERGDDLSRPRLARNGWFEDLPRVLCHCWQLRGQL